MRQGFVNAGNFLMIKNQFDDRMSVCRTRHERADHCVFQSKGELMWLEARWYIR